MMKNKSSYLIFEMVNNLKFTKIANLFIYQDYCLAKCPNQTYEEEELINNPETGEKGFRRICKPCTREKCPKSIYLIAF